MLFYSCTVPSAAHVQTLRRAYEPFKSAPSDAATPAPGASRDSDGLNESRIRRYLDQLQGELTVRNYSKNTIANYRTYVERFLRWAGAVSPQACREPAKRFCREQYTTRKLAPRTINLYCAALNFFLRHVLGAPTSQLLDIRMKTGKPLPKVYSLAQVERILNAVENEKHFLMLSMAYACGLRLGELRNLTVDNCDCDRGIVWVRNGKGGKDRPVMLDESLIPRLRAFIACKKGRAWLFESSYTGERLSRRSIAKVYEHACSRAGVTRVAGIHTLRHSFATHLLEQGVDLRYIQELLGHASTKTTELYTHVATHKIAQIKSPIANLSINSPERATPPQQRKRKKKKGTK
jgi:site-specific recombinase XerD